MIIIYVCQIIKKLMLITNYDDIDSNSDFINELGKMSKIE